VNRNAQESDYEIPVVVVGAGPAGIGLGVVLHDFKIANFLIADRHGIGASFERWPRETRLITPSFNTTPFGMVDLNAVALQTSVAQFTGEEHPTGLQYAAYLRALARACNLPVQSGLEIETVERRASGTFRLTTNRGHIDTPNLVWAAGEFQSPRRDGFPGAEQCLPTADIASYAELPGRDRIVIGAFESGVDAAVHLAEAGGSVVLLNSGSALATSEEDPSRSLSPFTRGRLERVQRETARIRIVHDSAVVRVTREDGAFRVRTSAEEVFTSPEAPILATGFAGCLGPVGHLFDHRDDGHVQLTAEDESTVAPGLFLVGPLVRQEQHIFCFIYKFRQRFAVVAETLATRLESPIPEGLLELYDKNQMRLTDPSCCGAECLC
jgi:cation diffusion facilitator CzcD-associated flavoprotein CzcO